MMRVFFHIVRALHTDLSLMCHHCCMHLRIHLSLLNIHGNISVYIRQFTIKKDLNAPLLRYYSYSTDTFLL